MYKGICKILFLIITLTISVSAKGEKAMVDSVNQIGYSFIVSNVHESVKLFTENIELARKIEYHHGEAVAQYNLALAYYISGKYDKSTSAFIRAINIFEEENAHYDLALVFGEFGYQLKRRDLGKAEEYMRTGISIAEEYAYDTLLTKLYNNYGVLKEMDGDLDSALYYYNKSLQEVYRMDYVLGIPYGLNKLAGVALLKGEYEKARGLLEKSDEYRANEEGDFGRVENLGLHGELYKAMGEYDKAIEYYEKCLSLSKKVDVNYMIRYSYDNLTELYKKTGNYGKALESLTKYDAYKDSVLNEEVQVRIAQLELDYQTEKKDRQIAESQLEVSELTAQLYLLIGIILILSISIYAIYKAQQRKRERERKELEYTTRLKQAEYENKITEEKLRISRELHDNIGSQLTFMISSLDNYSYRTQGEEANKLSGISNFGRDALKELRNTIWTLKNENSSLTLLVVKIRELVNQINSSIDSISINVENNVNGSPKLSAVQMLNIYRIVQEAAQNTIKYAEANNIYVHFNEKENNIILTIKDDGSGFDISTQANGNGLANMRQRCHEADGEIDIVSSANGTEITCRFNIK